MKKLIIFNDTYIKGLKKPSAGRYEKYHTGSGGFGIRVSYTGVKTWVYRYKINGKTDKITLGHYPTVSLLSAKAKFLELSGLRKEGNSPKEHIQQQAQKESNTVQELVISWYNGYASKFRKKPHKIKQQIDADIIPSLGHIQLDKLQTIEISKALDKIVQRGAPIHANRVLSTLKQALNYGVSRGSLKYNPASNIRTRDIGGLEKPRDRVLSLAEMKKLWLFLDSDQHNMTIHSKNALKILLLTGIRTSELRLATWDEFRLDESLWVIPAEHCKGGTSIKMHLSPLVQSILNELREINDTGYVIFGVAPNKPLSDSALCRAVNRIQERVGIPHWCVHDLRRSFSTHLGETLHIDPVVIEKCLSHKMPKIMATYNKNEMLEERRDALNKWGECINNLVSNSNIIPIKNVIY